MFNQAPPVGGNNGAKNSGKPIFSRMLRIVNPHFPFMVNFRGFRIAFSVDPDRIHHAALKQGRLQFVAYPDRIELKEIDQDKCRVLDQASLSRLDSCGKRYINADILFPEFGTVRRSNHYFSSASIAFIKHGNLRIRLPVDEQSLYGKAARERRIFVLANRRRIEFLVKEGEGKESPIGGIEIDEQGYLLRKGVRFLKDGFPVRINERKVCEINAAYLLERLRVKDIPVNLQPASNKILVLHRNVEFSFSADPKSLYLEDIKAGRIFMRAGYDDRLQVIRKTEEGEKILGAIPIRDGNMLVCKSGRRIRLGARRTARVRIEQFIEELGAKELMVTANFKKHGVAVVQIFNIRFVFPMLDGYVCREDILSYRMFCRIYPGRIVVGVKTKRGFREKGEIRFSRKGVLMLNGNPYLYKVSPVVKNDKRFPPVHVQRLIPELGRMEKRLGPGSARDIMWRGIALRFNLKRGDLYYEDFAAGRLVLRALDGRAEIYVDRGDGRKEYVGGFTLSEKKALLNDYGKAYEAEGGPIKAGQRRLALITRLVSILRTRGKIDPTLSFWFRRSDYNVIFDLFSKNGDPKPWLKRACVLARNYLSGKEPDHILVSKMMFALTEGVKKLNADTKISPDLRIALAEEVLDVMGLAVDHPALKAIEEVVRTQALFALAQLAEIRNEPDPRITRLIAENNHTL